ncbi:unnamed protein product [Caenorhabditis brenneri]
MPDGCKNSFEEDSRGRKRVQKITTLKAHQGHRSPIPHSKWRASCQKDEERSFPEIRLEDGRG